MAGSALEACRTTTRTDQRTEQRTRQFAPRKTFFSSSTCSFRNHPPFVPLPLPTNLSLPGGTHHPMWFFPTFHETFACFFSVAASLLRCSCFDVSEVARISREGSVVFLRGPFPVFFCHREASPSSLFLRISRATLSFRSTYRSGSRSAPSQLAEEAHRRRVHTWVSFHEGLG